MAVRAVICLASIQLLCAAAGDDSLGHAGLDPAELVNCASTIADRQRDLRASERTKERPRRTTTKAAKPTSVAGVDADAQHLWKEQQRKKDILMDMAAAKARASAFEGVCTAEQLAGANNNITTAAAAALPRCVQDNAACGSFVRGDGNAVSWRMISSSAPGCAYVPIVNKPSSCAEFARCAVKNERIALVGDSTTKQLFGALACLLDGERELGSAKRRRPGGLPVKTEAGLPMKWTGVPGGDPKDVCEQDVVVPKEVRLRHGGAAAHRLTWALPKWNATLSLRVAEDAQQLRDLVQRGTVWSVNAQKLMAPADRFTVLAANVGLHYPTESKVPSKEFCEAVMSGFDALRAHALFDGARVLWLEQQLLPVQNSRKFLEHNVTSTAEERRLRMNELARARGVPIVRTSAILRQHFEHFSANLHQVTATRYRAELLLNHIAKPRCFADHPCGESWSLAS